MRTPDRRTFLTTVGLAVGGTLAADSTIAAGDDAGFDTVQSSQLQYDAAKSGNGDTTGPSERLAPTWEFTDVGGNGVPSTPAVADGTLYFVSNGVDSADSSFVHAVSTDGDEQWRTETTVVQCSPAVADGLVFVRGPGGDLLALDAATGAEQWSHDGYTGYEGSPTVADGTLYVPSREQAGTLLALETTTGEQQWAANVDLPGSAIQMTAAAVANGVAYFGVGTDAGVGGLFAVDAATGEQLWHHDFDSVMNLSTPTVVDGQVFFSTDVALHAFSSDGTRQWRLDTEGFTPNYFTEQSPAVADGTLYFPDGTGLLAVDADAGERQWRFDPPAVTVASSPVVSDETVYVGTEAAGLYALDAATGDPVGQYRADPDARVIVPPVVVDGTAYVGGFSRDEDTHPGLTALASGERAAASAKPTPAFDVVQDEILRGMPTDFEDRSDAFGDFDPDDEPVTSRWAVDGEQVAEFDGTVDLTGYTFEESGDHDVTLTVENGYGWRVSTTRTVTVADEAYDGPEAVIETEPPDAEDRTFDGGETVTLDGSASTAGARDITDYAWTIHGTDHRSGPTTDVELEGLCGDWHVTLTVTDDLGVTDEATITLYVG